MTSFKMTVCIKAWTNFFKILLFCIPIQLRLRAFFHKTVQVCHVYCNFKIGFTYWITVIFGTLKDGSLLINTLASNICFCYRNMFQNGVDDLPKIVDAFLSKSSKFHQFGLSDNVQILLACGTNTYQGITNDISDFRCQHLQWQYQIPYRNINFSHLILRSSSFVFPLLLITVEVKNTICNSLITMFTTSWRNLIKIGWSELYKILSFFTKSRFKC